MIKKDSTNYRSQNILDPYRHYISDPPHITTHIPMRNTRSCDESLYYSSPETFRCCREVDQSELLLPHHI